MTSSFKAADQIKKKKTYISWSTIREQVKHIYLTLLWVRRVNLRVNTESPDVNSSSGKSSNMMGEMLFRKTKTH